MMPESRTYGTHAIAGAGKRVGDPDYIEGIAAAKIIFYKKAVDKTRNPAGKKMFLSMAEDERKRVRALAAILKQLGIRRQVVESPIKKIKTFFEKNGDVFLGKIKATTDDVDALIIAMEIEKSIIGLYNRLSKKAQTGKEKLLLEELKKDEQQHCATLSNTCCFLADPGNWFTIEEHCIMDGGTSWA